jgi:hypothetical protein
MWNYSSIEMIAERTLTLQKSKNKIKYLLCVCLHVHAYSYTHLNGNLYIFIKLATMKWNISEGILKLSVER